MRSLPRVLAFLGLAMSIACTRRAQEPVIATDFDGTSASIAVRSGWSGFEKAPDGVTFSWAEGQTALLVVGRLERKARMISFRAWSFDYPEAPQQLLTVFVNDTRIGELVIAAEPSEYSIDTPWSVWNSEENTIRLRFSRADAPKERIQGAEDARRLAVAFDWLRLVQTGR